MMTTWVRPETGSQLTVQGDESPGEGWDLYTIDVI